MFKRIGLTLILALTLQSCGTFKFNGQTINGRPTELRGVELNHTQGGDEADSHHHHNSGNRLWAFVIFSSLIYAMILEKKANDAQRDLYNNWPY